MYILDLDKRPSNTQKMAFSSLDEISLSTFIKEIFGYFTFKYFFYDVI